MNQNNNDKSSAPSDQQSQALLKILKKRGLLEDTSIPGESKRKADMDRKRRAYHNTLLLLKNYRDIAWMMECFPDHVAEELDYPVHDLDALIGAVSADMDMDKLKLEGRLKSIRRSRLLLDRVNEALTTLMRKPGNGKMMYDIIYQTFVAPDKIPLDDVMYRLNLSPRHYYRLRQQAVNILSLRLWSVPTAEMDSWLEVLTMLEGV
jgi:hypothetical protein